MVVVVGVADSVSKNSEQAKGQVSVHSGKSQHNWLDQTIDLELFPQVAALLFNKTLEKHKDVMHAPLLLTNDRERKQQKLRNGLS